LIVNLKSSLPQKPHPSNGGRPVFSKHDRVGVFLCILVDGGLLVTTKFTMIRVLPGPAIVILG
jgi:hypothetical protein